MREAKDLKNDLLLSFYCSHKKTIRESEHITQKICGGSQVVKGAGLRILSLRGSQVRILSPAYFSLVTGLL